MVKKVIIFLFVLTIVLFLSTKQDDSILIPDQSIRFRIIANSNSVQDQFLKMEVRKEILPILQNIQSDSIDQTRDNIKENIILIGNAISKYTTDFSIDFGQNYFPDKTYQGVLYDKGQYESLVITLGDAQGDNWWCVLFPPLCLIEADKNELD